KIEGKGPAIYLHEGAIYNISKKDVSRLGKLDDNAKIYNRPGSFGHQVKEKLLDHVYFIKKQAKADGKIYYLISKRASSTNGTIGWVHSKDIKTHHHEVANRSSRTLYINGRGHGKKKAWGGEKDIKYRDMAKYKGKAFEVVRSVSVGNNIWFR